MCVPFSDSLSISLSLSIPPLVPNDLANFALVSLTNQQNSSMDGVYSNRPTHPFKVIESDTMSIQSMTSLGRVGRILAGSIDPSGNTHLSNLFVYTQI